MTRLAVLGDAVEDIVCWLATDVRGGTDTAVTVHRTRGGSAANVAVAASRGVPTRFLGAVGADPGGQLVRESLAAAGVDVRLQTGSRTGTIVVLVHPDGERDMFPDRGASAEIRPIEPAWLDGVDALHLTAYSLAVDPARSSALDAAARVRASGGWVSLDLSSAGLIEQLGLDVFAGLVDAATPAVVFANADEARLTDAAARFCAALVVVKRGAAPVEVTCGGRRVEVAVPPADVRDTTGAGDAFAGGFLAAALASGGDPRRADEASWTRWAQAGIASAQRVLVTPGA